MLNRFKYVLYTYKSVMCFSIRKIKLECIVEYNNWISYLLKCYYIYTNLILGALKVYYVIFSVLVLKPIKKVTMYIYKFILLLIKPYLFIFLHIIVPINNLYLYLIKSILHFIFIKPYLLGTLLFKKLLVYFNRVFTYLNNLIIRLFGKRGKFTLQRVAIVIYLNVISIYTSVSNYIIRLNRNTIVLYIFFLIKHTLLIFIIFYSLYIYSNWVIFSKVIGSIYIYGCDINNIVLRYGYSKGYGDLYNDGIFLLYWINTLNIKSVFYIYFIPEYLIVTKPIEFLYSTIGSYSTYLITIYGANSGCLYINTRYVIHSIQNLIFNIDVLNLLNYMLYPLVVIPTLAYNYILYPIIGDGSNHSWYNILGVNIIFISLNAYIMYNIINSSNTISIFLKLITYLIVGIVYLIVLNLDPWACFLIVVEFSAIFLLVIVLNSIKYKKDPIQITYLSKVLYIALFIFSTTLILKLPYSNIDALYTNLYTKNNFFSNSDFFGLTIELFSSTIIVPYIIVLLLMISIYIIIRFKFNHTGVNLENKKLTNYLTSVVSTNYISLVDEYFILTKPTIRKWFGLK